MICAIGGKVNIIVEKLNANDCWQVEKEFYDDIIRNFMEKNEEVAVD
jgi:hypothetical protein